MKQLFCATIIALAFTGTASAYDNYSNNNYSNNNSYAVEKPDQVAKKKAHSADIYVETDPNPSKLKKQLKYFEKISGTE